MKQVKGIIQAISYSGGVKIAGKWYNPANEKGRQHILENKEKLKKEKVVLALDDKGKIIGYTISGEEEEKEEIKEKSKEKQEVKKPLGTTNKTNQRPPTNQEMVVRENALRHATLLTTTIYSGLPKEKQEKITVDDLTQTTLRIAKKIEKEIRRRV